jgi:hypothetical protein
VSKNGLILTSLVGAVPGLLMAYLMVMAFINYAGGQTVIHKILCVLLLLIGLLLAAMPVGIFVLAGPKAEKAPAKKKDDEAAEVAEEASGEAASGEVVEAEETVIGEASDFEDENPADVTDENLEVDEGPADEFAVTGEVVTDDVEAGSEDFGAEEELEVEEAEEEAPKKGKKK